MERKRAAGSLQCTPGNCGTLFGRYKGLCPSGMSSYSGKRAAASLCAISRALCGIGENCVQNAARTSVENLMREERFDPSVLPFMGRFLSWNLVSGFYIAVSIDCFRDIFCCSGKFRASMLPFFNYMLRSTEKGNAYIAAESVRGLFRNHGFEEGWLTRDSYDIIRGIMRTINPDPNPNTVPTLAYSFTSLLADRGFSAAGLPKLYGGMKSLSQIEIARYFSSLMKDRHPNAAIDSM
jgi:hypothetical protein